jgi:hypothetical protein
MPDVQASGRRRPLPEPPYVYTLTGFRDREVVEGPSRGLGFSHSTLEAVPLDPAQLRKRDDRFVPRLGDHGRALSWVLAEMDGTAPLGDIAREAARRFPGVFRDARDALAYVGDLSHRWSD